jgi:hypothetical protein
MRNNYPMKRMRACAPVWRVAIGLMAVAVLPPRATAQINTTTVQGTVYRADGTAASGTLLVSWSAFTTPQNQAVAAGNLSTAIGADGFVSLNLMPNANALPAGSYYSAVYHLSDGTVNQQYWVVPASATASLASVEAQLEPSTEAVQPVSQAYVNSAISSLGGSFLPLAGGTLTGPLTLNSDPAAASQAATKHYADQLAAANLPLAGGVLTGPLTAPQINARQMEGALYADQWQSGSGSNDGIAMSLTECAAYTYACQVIAPALYAQAEAQPWGGAGSIDCQTCALSGPSTGQPIAGVVDYRYGPPMWFFNSAEQYNDNRHFASPTFGMNTTSWGAGLYPQSPSGLWVFNRGLMGGRNFSPTPPNGDKANFNAMYVQAQKYTEVQDTGSVFEASYGYGNGDLVGHQIYTFSYGGPNTNGDEANEAHRDFSVEGGAVFSATASTITTGADGSETITTTAPTNSGTQGEGRLLIDLTQAYNAGYISTYTPPNYTPSFLPEMTCTGCTWDSTFGDTTQTTLTAAIPQGSTNLFPESNVVISVASTTGFSAGQRACIWDFDYECEKVTAVGSGTITLATVRKPHPVSPPAYITTGGLTGYGFRSVADDVVPGNTLGVPVAATDFNSTISKIWPIVMNTSGNNAYLFIGANAFPGVSVAAGAQTRMYTQMGSGGTVTLTVAGGVATACAASGGTGYSGQAELYGQIQNPPQVTVTGTYTTPPVVTITGVSAGALSSCTATPGSGVTVATATVVPTNSYVIYPAAKVYQVYDAANGAVDGTFYTQPFAGTVSRGDLLSEPHYFMQETKNKLAVIGTLLPSQINGNSVQDTYITGVFQGQDHLATYWNQGSPTLYAGFPTSNPQIPGTGQLPTPDGFLIQGPYVNDFDIDTPPFGTQAGSRGAAVLNLGCGGIPCVAWTNGYNIVKALNAAGWSDTLHYTPATNAWLLTSGATQYGGGNPVCSYSFGGSGNGLSVSCGGSTSKFDASGNLSVAGLVRAQSGVTGATINGEITVDGVTYTTLAAAWNAAVSQANASGQNQTVRLGPGTFPVTATLAEPANGACVSVLGSAGTTVNADSTQIATTLTVPVLLNGDIFYLGNGVQAQGCTFKDLNILAGGNAAHGFELQWFRGVLIDNVTVNDTTAEGILLGEENTATGHQANFLLRNVTVSYSSAAFTPANRSPYGIHLLKTAIDSHLDDIVVRNAQTAAVYNEGTGNTGYLIHGFGYPYTCSSGPCVNNASSGSAANASYATNYVVYDTGGSGSTWTDTYVDSPAIAGFYIGANGVEIHGGHIQWPDVTSFPAANLAYVASNVSNNLLIADVDCLEMASGVNWITYAGSSGNPPTYSSVHHLTGCGNYYQALEDAEVTGFSSGGANINDPSSAVPRVWSTPVAAAASYPAYSAQMYTGYQGDAFQAHFSGVNPFFNITYQGTIRSSGGIALSTIINTASTLTLTAANKNVIANAASGAQTITLPSCYTPLPDRASPTGLEFTIVKSDTSSNPVTLQTTSSESIYAQGSSAATLVLSSPSTQTLVCGPDYNWYIAGSASATVSGGGVSSFNGRSGAVTPASNDYSFSQLSGQASNAQLPSALTASTTGNASTATALAATPSQCPAGYYATGVTANGTANCLQSWHFTWYGNFAGTFGTSTNNSLGSIWSPSAAINMTRLDIAVGTAPSGCSTYPVIGVYDSTSSAWLKTVTLASGTYSYRNAVSGVSITAGHNLSMGVQTAAAGCNTNAGSAQLTMEYTMNQ